MEIITFTNQVITSMLNNFCSTSCDDRFKQNIFNFIIEQVFFVV